MNEYDVVIRMSEPRYWVLLVGSLLAGRALIRRFQSLDDGVKDRALRQLGWVLLLLQLGYQGWMVFDEAFDWTIHRSLPLHFVESTSGWSRSIASGEIRRCICLQPLWEPSEGCTPF